MQHKSGFFPRPIKDFPFPAITFYPGDFNSKNGFMQTFLNQFQFTRYEENSPLNDNDIFMKSFDWLIKPMHNKIFDGVENFLIEEEKFIKEKGKIFKTEVCSIVALEHNKIAFKEVIWEHYQRSMYKTRGFRFILKEGYNKRGKSVKICKYYCQ